MEMSRKEIESMAKRFREGDPRVSWMIQGFVYNAMDDDNEELTYFLLDIFEPDIVRDRMYDQYFIHRAAEKNWLRVTQKLIRLGVNPTFGLLPAVSEGNKKMVELLIANKADIHYGNVLYIAEAEKGKSEERAKIYAMLKGMIEG